MLQINGMKKVIFPTGFLLFLVISIAFNSCKHEPIVPVTYINPNDTTGSGPDSLVEDTTISGIQCNPDTVYFENDILPLLSSTCAKPGCHDAGTAQEGVILTDYQSIISRGKVRPGRPENSDLWRQLVRSGDEKMPPPSSGLSLSQAQIDMIYKWILQGAKNNHCSENAGQCNTVNMSFKDDINPILKAHCLGCHSGNSLSGNINLSGYYNVKVLALDGRLYGVISHSKGYVNMPYAQPKLSECKIDKIKSWIDAGAPNN